MSVEAVFGSALVALIYFFSELILTHMFDHRFE